MEIEKIVKLLEETPFEWYVPDDRIVVINLEGETKSAGGIIIPDTAKEKPTKGILVGVGENLTLDESGLKKANPSMAVGDLIVYGKYAGTEMDIEWGKEKITVMIMRSQDYILGKKGYIKSLKK